MLVHLRNIDTDEGPTCEVCFRGMSEYYQACNADTCDNETRQENESNQQPLSDCHLEAQTAQTPVVSTSSFAQVRDRDRGDLDLHLRCRQEGDSAVKDDVDDGRCVDLMGDINACAAVLCLPPVEKIGEGLARCQRCYDECGPVAG